MTMPYNDYPNDNPEPEDLTNEQPQEPTDAGPQQADVNEAHSSDAEEQAEQHTPPSEAFTAAARIVLLEHIESYRQIAYEYALRAIGDHDAAEDIAQRCIEIALATIGNFRGSGDPEDPDMREREADWIRGIANNLKLMHFRQKRRQDQQLIFNDALALASDPQTGPSQQLEYSEQLRELFDVAGLTDNQKLAIYLTEELGLSAAQAAKIIGTSEGAVRGLKYRAINRLWKAAQDLRKRDDSTSS